MGGIELFVQMCTIYVLRTRTQSRIFKDDLMHFLSLICIIEYVTISDVHIKYAQVLNGEVEVIPVFQTALNVVSNIFIFSTQAGVDSWQISLYGHLLQSANTMAFYQYFESSHTEHDYSGAGRL